MSDEKPTHKMVEFVIIVKVPADTEQPLLAYELGEAVKLIRSFGRAEPISTSIKEYRQGR